AARVQHDHVATVYDVGEVDGTPYYSMRFIEGVRLIDVLPPGGMPGPRAAGYMRTVARAVHAIHQHHIVHRDLTARNILIDETGRPYVTDFGLARWSDGGDRMTPH